MSYDNEITIDFKDRDIVKILQNRPKITHKGIVDELAKRKVKLSRQSVQKRIKRLESDGVIKYAVLANDKKLGKEITVFILIELQTLIELGSYHDRQLDVHTQILSRMKELEIVEIHYVAGQEDILVKMRTRTIDTLRVNLVKISQMGGVARTRTLISLAFFEQNFPETEEEFLNALKVVVSERQEG
ncbi:MAG: Lrp/AsnC ligand binding domain-containing protein [Candidatus Heimdallarchaeota archaeon]|nr:MAG: Lrp/AsnC ligand binding domain-containing protein [Candidatus Heimdallarchaeota archaeon]